MAELIGVTGKSGVGKTKVCQEIVQAAKSNECSVFGFYCPAVFENGEKTGIEVSLLPGEDTYLLATLEHRIDWLQIGRWSMDPNVFDLANEHLISFRGSDLLLIDEIGPAEIEGKKGWPSVLKLLQNNRFKIGVVSFRPAYIELFKEAFPAIKVINLDEGGRSEVDHLVKRLCKSDLPA